MSGAFPLLSILESRAFSNNDPVQDMEVEKTRELDADDRMLYLISVTFSGIGHSSQSWPNSRFLKSDCYERVALPAFSHRNLVIRPPFPNEAKIVSKLLIFSDQKKVKAIIQKNKSYRRVFGSKKNHTILVIQERNGKIQGAVDFLFENIIGLPHGRFCHISSLGIDQSMQGRGYGSLLLACVILEANEMNFESLQFLSNEEGAPLYDKFCFRTLAIPESTWETYPKEERIQQLGTAEDDIIFETNNPRQWSRLESIIEQI